MATAVRHMVVVLAFAASVACDGGDPPSRASAPTAEVTQIVVMFKSAKSPKATRSKEEARAIATSLQADLVAGRNIADLMKFTDFVDRDHKPYNKGRSRVTKDWDAAPALRDAIFATPVGGIGKGPIEIEFGFVLFRREE